jgi:hypothetical protein
MKRIVVTPTHLDFGIRPAGQIKLGFIETSNERERNRQHGPLAHLADASAVLYAYNWVLFE